MGPVGTMQRMLVLLSLLGHVIVTTASCRVAVVGGGVGGAGAAYHIKRLRPGCEVALYERRTRLGGRIEEFDFNGKVFEVGASIIHVRNQYMLDAIDILNLTIATGDDTSSTFSIFDGKQLVYTQDDGVFGSLKALVRYGLSPLRFSQLSSTAGSRFGSIYALQGGGTWFRSPDEMLGAIGLLELTMDSLQTYAESHLTWLWRPGSAAFMEELVGAVNRINYNQRNQQLNALAGLVSFLPAAEPEVFSVKGGNSAVAQGLAQAADLTALHLGCHVRTIRALPDGTWELVVAPNVTSRVTQGDTRDAAAGSSSSSSGGSTGATAAAGDEVHGPFDVVILAAPLKGSGVAFEGFTPPPIAPRQYQSTVTSYIAGVLNPAYFGMDELPDGDIFVTNSAPTNWTVLAVKGPATSITSCSNKTSSCKHKQHSSSCSKGTAEGDSPQKDSHHKHRPRAAQQSWWRQTSSSVSRQLLSWQQGATASHHSQPHPHQPQRENAAQEIHRSRDQLLPSLQQRGADPWGPEHKDGSSKPQLLQQPAGCHVGDPGVQLFKMFSEQPLSETELSAMFLQHEVVHRKDWLAYPKYQAPEELPPFLLAAGLVYNNALEAAASAMEVALVAAVNSALLVDHHLTEQQAAAAAAAAAGGGGSWGGNRADVSAGGSHAASVEHPAVVY